MSNALPTRSAVDSFYELLTSIAYAVKSRMLPFLMLLFLHAATFAQTRLVADKIDPVFRYLIDQSKSPTSLQKNNLPPIFAIEPTKGFASKGSRAEDRYECIVYTKDARSLRDSNIVVNTVLPDFVTAWVTPDQIVQMSLMPGVTFIEAPKQNYPSNDVAVGSSGASLLHQGRLNNTAYKGKNVIVGIYDTGIDWDHFDFRDPADTTKSRILRIWDQTLNAVGGEAPPAPFSYGVEYTQAQINNELDGTPANVVRENDINGHGTHVAGTAAGNGSAFLSKKYAGMAPEADIVIIKGSNTSFSESRMIDGLTYLNNLAAALGKPAVMNWSIGSQFGPHDGTRPYEVAINSFTSSAPGRVVAVSAGNDNGMNLHNRIILAANATSPMSFAVSDSTASDVFEYRMYANDTSDISATVTAPDGMTLTANIRQSVSTRVLSDSFTVSLFNQIDPGNANRYIDVYVSRTGTNTRRPTGTWTLSIKNNTSNTLTMDGWLYYKNTAFTATTLVGGNSDYLVTSPANATSAIAVASYTGKNNWYSSAVPGPYTFTATRSDSISSFSSRGPRRDGVLKPEIAAVGEVVVSCLSSNASFSSTSVVENGLYVIDQGTSMASPGVTGAAALLLQANPNASSAQIKNLLTSAANNDGFAGSVAPTPNPSWGYGKLDVYKAASLLFNCGPADRRTYKYDSSTRNAQEAAFGITTEQLAVRFTPDVSGKLGGVFFHTNTTITALSLEVRSNNAGTPGTLLGTLGIDSNRITKYSFNYIDISSMNIAVTSGTDYFIVLRRATASNAGWSLRYENIVLNGRSQFSTNGGTTWLTLNGNLKIRSVVYNNAQLAGNIATINSTDQRNINTSNQFINSSCQLISQVVPGGASAVSGNLTGKVWIESAVPHYAGKPYVQRHYDISSADAAATGRVTLYFTQNEFTAFNTDAASTPKLPTGSSDASGIANLRIGKYAGSSTGNSGLIGTYDGPGSIIDPADSDIVYNAGASRWEVSFNTTGLGGFFVQTALYVLPIAEEYFRGTMQRAENILNWKITCTTSAVLTIERSGNGIDYNSIGSITATQNDCLRPFAFTDASPLQGNNFYRIKIAQNNANTVYTSTILLQNDRQQATKLFPTLIHSGSRVQISFGDAKGYLYINDAVGKQVLVRSLNNGVQSVDLGLRSKGVYFYTIKNEQTVLAAGKIVVE